MRLLALLILNMEKTEEGVAKLTFTLLSLIGGKTKVLN